MDQTPGILSIIKSVWGKNMKKLFFCSCIFYQYVLPYL